MENQKATTDAAQAESFDAVILGGGPGGSTAGAYLAMAGRKVLILEREKFPRFHIGESMLPFSNDIFKETGVWPKLERGGFMPKLGAEFCTANGSRFQRFWFGRGIGPAYAQTFQVERARFDQVLLNHAASLGCTVREEARAVDVDLAGDEHVVKYEWMGGTSTARCRWLLDATGRDTFMGKKLGLPRVPTQDDRRIATYAHFRGVFRNEGDAAGHITIVRLPGGWFWFIPLDAEKTSVGFVQRVDDLRASGRRPEESFDFVTQNYKELHARLREAERIGEIHTTADYSYRFEDFSPHPRVFFVGDAAGFTDPIFSSGVMMAMKSARLAARLISETDRARKAGLPAARRRYYTREVGRMMMVYIKMITAFYDNPSFELFMHPAPVMKIPDAIVAIVGGATELPFRLWWRMKVFYLLCSLQRRLGIAPRIDFRAEEAPREPDRKPMQETTTPVAPKM
jgi:flavin-dependent dehydrogenase